MVRKLLVASVLILCVVAIFFVGVVASFDRWLETAISIEEPVQFVVKRGRSFEQISTMLEDVTLIDNAGKFVILGWLKRMQSSVQAGEYVIEDSVTPVALLEILVQGNVAEYNVMLPEGGTYARFKQILALEQKLELDIELIGVETILTHLGVAEDSQHSGNAHGEGWFFPDTYQYRNGDTAGFVLLMAYDRMQEELSIAWRDRSIPSVYENRYDLLKLASIVEKETSLSEDRPKVSGVFVRRLEKGMRLQADPTVIYGLGNAFTGNLTREHLREDNDYNTYVRYGLPPTPISNPSAESLIAASRYAVGEDLYFVGRGDGTTQFSKTLQEHNEAVRRYQRN